MSNLGIANVRIAKVTKDGVVKTGVDGIFGDASDKSGIFTADEKTAYGVASLAVSNIQGSLTSIWGSNHLIKKSAGKGEVQSVLTVNALPSKIKQNILGNKSDGKGGYGISGKADTDNYIAILAESAEAFGDEAPIYVGMYMGIATETSETFTTNNTAETRGTDVITIAHQERGVDNFGKRFFSDESGFSESDMLADVFKTSSTPAPAPAG